MFFGTDLAMERREIAGDIEGLTHSEQTVGDATVSTIEVTTPEAAKALGKPEGRYITVSVPSMRASRELFDGRVQAVADCLARLLPQDGGVLVVGLGNLAITSDAIGPKCAEKVFATSHIDKQLAQELGFAQLRKVSVLAPGVAGKTGLEASHVIRSICADLHPAVIIAVDALAARDLARVGTTIQMTDTGVAPGSGVGNARKVLNRQNLGIPVIAVGIPTVIHILHAALGLFGDALTDEKVNAAKDEYRNTIVTVREADTMVERAAALTAMAINKALQPSLSQEELTELTLG